MTIKELSQLYYLNREIEREQLRIRELEDAATNTAAKITGLPHTGSISNNTAIAAQIADCRTIVEAKQRAAVAEYNRLMRYIAGIDDSLMRQILTLRYINGFTWNQVADSIGITENSAKQAHSRFLRKSCHTCHDEM